MIDDAFTVLRFIVNNYIHHTFELSDAKERERMRKRRGRGEIGERVGGEGEGGKEV